MSYKPLYNQPETLLGETVYWYSGGDTSATPYAAIVSKVNFSSLCLHVLWPSHPGLKLVDGARHASEKLTDYERADAGCWETLTEYRERRGWDRLSREEQAEKQQEKPPEKAKSKAANAA